MSEAVPTGPAVLLDIADRIAEIRFNRPERLNAISVEVAEAFAAAVASALADQAVSVIVVSAEGRAFVAGGDLAHLRAASDRAQALGQLVDPMHSALKALAASPKITIGSIQGAAAGAGMSLALAFDMVIAAETATFNFAYSRVAASGDCGATWSLPQLVGPRRALEIALFAEPIDAEAAQRLGIVNRVVAADQLRAETRAMAQRIAAGAGMAFGEIKALIRGSSERDFAAHLDAEAKSFARCTTTQDFGEALDAFFGRRAPQFSGR
jgi:2-(1,2-epoxy-1,2-dihydrophenyl)acetyl-CoA isomerase